MFATALVALSPAVITQGQRVRVMAARSFSTATNRPPLVSVIMANYNCADYLAAAIASAQRQTVANIEIIVADDGSTDSSVAIVTRLMADDARIRLIKSNLTVVPPLLATVLLRQLPATGLRFWIATILCTRSGWLCSCKRPTGTVPT